MRRTLVITGAILGLGRAAEAGPSVAGTLDCKAGKRAIAFDQANPIDNHLVCTVRVTGALAEGTRATVTLVQEGKPEAVRESAAWKEIESDTEGEPPSFELRLDPFVRIEEFRPCNDFTLRLAVGDLEVEHVIQTRCKKPKKLKAKLTCEYWGPDGAGPIAYPGKKKPRLESTLTCWVRAGKGKAGDGAVATLVAGEMPWVEPLYVDDDSKQWTAGALLEPDEDFTACEPFTVKGWITSALGQVVWTGKLAIPQRCD